MSLSWRGPHCNSRCCPVARLTGSSRASRMERDGSKKSFFLASTTSVTSRTSSTERSGTGALELSVAGNYGARFFSRSLQLQSSVDFDVPKPYPTYSVDIVPQSRSNPLMFYRHSNWSEYDSLFGADGKELWRTPHGCLTGALVTLSEDASPDLLCVQDSPECCSLEARNVGNTAVWNTPVRWLFNLAFLGPSATPAIVIDQPGTDSNSLALMGLDPRGQQVFTRQPVVSLLGGLLRNPLAGSV